MIRRFREKRKIQLKIKNNKVEVFQDVKYLEIFLDNKLTYNCILRRINGDINRETALCLCYCHALYIAQLFCINLKSNEVNRLRKMQNKAMRIILNYIIDTPE